jgi:MarR family transcriptional regulator for hemolysin
MQRITRYPREAVEDNRQDLCHFAALAQAGKTSPMEAKKKTDKGGAFPDPHDYQAYKPLLDPLFRGEIDYLIRMIRMREIYAIELMLEPVGLTLSAWYPLAVLRVEDGMPQRELGSRLNLKDAAIGKAIDALERAGLIARKNDPNDRRKTLVYLTDEGKKTGRTVAKMREEFQSVVFDGFSRKDKDLFRELLERAYDNIGQFITSRG